MFTWLLLNTSLPELFLITQTFLIIDLRWCGSPFLQFSSPSPLPFFHLASCSSYFTSQLRSFSVLLRALGLAEASLLGAFTATYAYPAIPLIVYIGTTKLYFLGSNGPFTASSEGLVVPVFSTSQRMPGSLNGCMNERVNEWRRHYCYVGLGVSILCILMLHSITCVNSVKPDLQASASSPIRLGEVQQHSWEHLAGVLSFSIHTKAQQSWDFSEGR